MAARRSSCGRRGCSSSLVATQITLGALVVLTGKQPVINTLHVATGALVLGTSLVLTLRTFRVRVAAQPRSASVKPALQPTTIAAATRTPADRSSPIVARTLTKVRLNALVVATTAGGYYMAAPTSAIDPVALAVTCLGTALVASGAAAINQVTSATPTG